MMAVWISACRLDEIAEGRGKALELAGARVAVFRVGLEVWAISGRCPHAGGALGWGWVEQGEVVCPLHRWRFRLKDGRCSTIRGESVECFPCEIRGDHVWVAI